MHFEWIAALRKRWYLVLLAVMAVGGIIWFVQMHDLDYRVLLRRYGYMVILVWTFLEGETIVIIAGISAGALGLNPWFIALCAFAGSFCSDQFMFSLGKYKGEAVLGRFPRIAKNLDKAARLFKKYDVALILGFRFIYGVRNVTPIMLGISGVSHLKFFALNMIGAGVWALTFCFGGYYAKEVFVEIIDLVGHGILYAILLAAALGVFIWYVRARRDAKKIREKEEAAGLKESAPLTHIPGKEGDM